MNICRLPKKKQNLLGNKKEKNMNTYEINIPKTKQEIKPLLKEGKISANSLFFTKENKPWIPIMGEFHYSRYPQEEWLKELRKMKAGGIEIVASYVIWIHHEEIEDQWDFSGNKDLRYFIELCEQVGLKVFLRVGPWAHGEVRNGGFPDWLLGKTETVRLNDDIYLSYVDSFFKKIYEQCQGLFLKDGGPICGVQIENEYGHVGGSNQKVGYEHLEKLFAMLKEIGFDVPIYTATAWGGAIFLKEMIPVFGGYVEAPWAQTTKKLPLSENFLIRPERDDHTIASDYEHETKEALVKVSDYPFATAELGGGLQVTHHRRPYVTGDDIYGQAFGKFASGANLLGYYMYHGGTNPTGKLTTLQESKVTGSPNDLPIKSYDFQGPLGEFGDSNKSYFLLRKLHLFIKNFEEILAPSITIFPEKIILDPSDKHLKISLRHNYELGGGFVFISNYQRQDERKEVKDVYLTLNFLDHKLTLPPFDCPANGTLILPYNLPIFSSTVESSNVPLMGTVGNELVFSSENPETVQVNFKGEKLPYVVFSPKEINQMTKINEKLYFCEGIIWSDEKFLYCDYVKDTEIKQYPSGKVVSLKTTKISSQVTSYLKNKNQEATVYELHFNYQKEQAKELRLKLHYSGDKCELWTGEDLIGDQFMVDGYWTVSLSRFNFPDKLTLKIFAPNEEVYYDCPVNPKEVKLISCELEGVFRKIIE